MTIDIQKFKNKLEEEKKILIEELGEVGRKTSESPSGWEATPPEQEQDVADKNVLADNVEEYEERFAVENTLQKRLGEINSALSDMEKGGYGVCSVCGEEIEEKRLDANPAANTCVKHLN